MPGGGGEEWEVMFGGWGGCGCGGGDGDEVEVEGERAWGGGGAGLRGGEDVGAADTGGRLVVWVSGGGGGVPFGFWEVEHWGGCWWRSVWGASLDLKVRLNRASWQASGITRWQGKAKYCFLRQGSGQIVARSER